MLSRVRVGAGTALVGMVLAVAGVSGVGTSQAASVTAGTVAVIGNTPYSSAGKQCDPSPNRDGWHVIMNGIEYPNGAVINGADFGPVNLTFSNGSTAQALFTDLSGNSTAHFLNTTVNQVGTFTITAASMTFPAGTDITGYNNFVISHPPCQPAVTTTTTTLPPTTTTTTLPPTTTTTTLPPTTTTTTTTTLPPTTTTTTTLPPTTTTTTTTTLPPTTTTTLPPPVFELSAEAVCRGNVPYLKYLVTENGQPVDRPVQIRLIKLNVPQGIDPSAGGFVGDSDNEFLWPGAAVDSTGNAIDWPGWKLVNGEWVTEQDYLRPNLQIEATLLEDQGTERIEATFVGDTATMTVSYPPATAACADPPQTESNPPTTTAPPTTVKSGGPVTTTIQPRLPTTGGGSTNSTLLALGAFMMLMGLAFSALGRKRTDI